MINFNYTDSTELNIDFVICERNNGFKLWQENLRQMQDLQALAHQIYEAFNAREYHAQLEKDVMLQLEEVKAELEPMEQVNSICLLFISLLRDTLFENFCALSTWNDRYDMRCGSREKNE